MQCKAKGTSASVLLLAVCISLIVLNLLQTTCILHGHEQAISRQEVNRIGAEARIQMLEQQIAVILSRDNGGTREQGE